MVQALERGDRPEAYERGGDDGLPGGPLRELCEPAWKEEEDRCNAFQKWAERLYEPLPA